MTAYAELAATTNFSFLRGASHPQEMVAAAEALGLAAIGIADRNSLPAWCAPIDAAGRSARPSSCSSARASSPTDGFEVLAYPTDRAAYGRLCRLLTLGNSARPTEGRMPPHLRGDAGGQRGPDAHRPAAARRSRRPSPNGSARSPRAAPGRTFLAGVHRYRGDEPRRLGLLDELGQRTRRAARRRQRCALSRAGAAAARRRAHLHPREMHHRRGRLPARGQRRAASQAAGRDGAAVRRLSRTRSRARVEIADACRFSLDELQVRISRRAGAAGQDAAAASRRSDLGRARASAIRDGIPDEIARRCIAKELALIARLDYARYFLTVYDVVRFARSAEADPVPGPRLGGQQRRLLLPRHHRGRSRPRSSCCSRASSRQNRDEPPDIDVDFEHERREEVIQYLYQRYGRERAAICATVIHYRSRMAIREVGKALGLTPDVTAALAKTVWGYRRRRAARRAHPPGRARSRPIRRSAQAVALAQRAASASRAISPSTSAASC